MTKDDGSYVEVQWQDTDNCNSSPISFLSQAQNQVTHHSVLCAGHVGRYHTKALSQKKRFIKLKSTEKLS